MVFTGQPVDEAMGTNECSLVSSDAGDLRCAQIAKGMADAGLSVHMQVAAGLHAGFNMGSSGLNVADGAARPEGWAKPDVAPQTTGVQSDLTRDFT